MLKLLKYLDRVRFRLKAWARLKLTLKSKTPSSYPMVSDGTMSSRRRLRKLMTRSPLTMMLWMN